jgi:hypothetical protein
MVYDAASPEDKIIAGFACLLISLRSRYHDAMTVEKLVLDLAPDWLFRLHRGPHQTQ